MLCNVYKKAQGQTLDSVVVHLPEHVFTHAKLCAAFSRVHTLLALAVYVDNTDGYIKNIVYQEVLWLHGWGTIPSSKVGKMMEPQSPLPRDG